MGNNGCLQRKDLISGLERLGVGGHSFMEDGKQTSEIPLKTVEPCGTRKCNHDDV